MTNEEILRILNNFCFEDFSDLDLSRFTEFIKRSKLSDYTVYSGATKVVIAFDDFVIKIPFCGDEDKDFSYAPENCVWDYCLAEVKRYAIAEISGFAMFFAKTELIGDIKGHPVYRQPKAEIDFFNQNYMLSKNKKYSVAMDLSRKITGNLSYEWIYESISCYGLNIVENFINFLKDTNICDDLHTRNIGHRDGFPVLVDYSGFYEDNY